MFHVEAVIFVRAFLFLFTVRETAFKFKCTLFLTRRINKVLGPLSKSGIKFVPEACFRNARRFNERKTFAAKNEFVRLADTPIANLIKAKSTENTNSNRQYSLIDFCHFFAG